jgi:hypothetical protein
VIINLLVFSDITTVFVLNGLLFSRPHVSIISLLIVKNSRYKDLFSHNNKKVFGCCRYSKIDNQFLRYSDAAVWLPFSPVPRYLW